MAKRNYSVGDGFLVPLRNGGYGLGVVARMNAGGVLFGYFFGPKFATAPGPEALHALSPGYAVLMGKFGHLALKDRSWPILGRVSNWDASQWPFPSLIRPDSIRGGAFLVTYDDDDPLRQVSEQYFPAGVIVDGPADGLMGAGFVETRLTRLLSADADG